MCANCVNMLWYCHSYYVSVLTGYIHISMLNHEQYPISHYTAVVSNQDIAKTLISATSATIVEIQQHLRCGHNSFNGRAR